MSIGSLPPEMWTEIIGYLDLQTLLNLSFVNRKINHIVKGKFQSIRSNPCYHLEVNIKQFYKALSQVKELYVIKYNYKSKPSVDIENLGKYVLLDYDLFSSKLTLEKKIPKCLQPNQILITPHFSKAIRGEITIENNPLEDYLSLELLEKDERLIVEDHLSISKITYFYKTLNLHQEIALKLASNKVHDDFAYMNDSWMRFIFKSCSKLFHGKGF